MGRLELLPAVDMQGGQAVQLVQGVAGSQKVFGEPLAAARRWQAAGAKWLHLVDLDQAFGRGSNALIAAEIVAELDINVELTGGIRDDASLERAFATGCKRVNIGTAAVEKPEWAASVLKEYGERVAIALDVKDGKLATRGWVQTADDLDLALERLNQAGCQCFVVTDVNSDGMLRGPNIELLKHVCARTDAQVVASGGISSLADLASLANLTRIGVRGAIIGTALYLGNFTLEEALGLGGDYGD
ncbi:MAG: bifunctional 1-(5-phosphoribosyl)-5-((5-phosphoribosylamino)methylideneamino)imidazole-4-carboxamide isomerase/phosphoribosylanthranilate isomerase PriA [Propionibacteriaceae bacterium]|jgi:phosphoribosylanthranilate isomerase|nr:bifunctional 1-(5-phosphoribosyl)-5-((5-phosphoribosylamino)methylideneamino)imidazole-4-carboxamide isomerase/phosphoribosylanthranilate isomerase PriA [Propionibacteriaceae bacterium]